MRKFNITVDGKTYNVEVEEIGGVASAPAVQVAAPASAPVENTASAPVAVGNGTKVNAPMPGMILGLKAENGSKVTRGQVIVTLEAMKMENDIAAPCDGIITYVVQKGANVNSGDLIATIA